MRVVFMGTSEFALPSLRRVAERTEIVAVVAQPDRPVGRGLRLAQPPVARLAAELGLPVHQPEKARDKRFVSILRELAPDGIVVAAYGQLLPKTILTLAPFGCVNVHPSLLPRYRGAAPIAWTLWNGETETGVTLIQLDEGEDSGPILAQRRIAIGPDETALDLNHRLAQLGADMLAELLASLRDNPPTPVPQDDLQATRAPRLNRAMGQADWGVPASVLYNRFRACVPWPSTYTYLPDGSRLRILDCRPRDGDLSVVPSSIHERHGHLLAQTGEGLLEIRRVQPENRSAMSVRDWWNGFRKATPERFERREETDES